jgi:hypothetical protein
MDQFLWARVILLTQFSLPDCFKAYVQKRNWNQILSSMSALDRLNQKSAESSIQPYNMFVSNLRISLISRYLKYDKDEGLVNFAVYIIL